MSTPLVTDRTDRTVRDTARPYLASSLAALSAGAAAIHFAVIFEHFSEYVLYGVFFLIVSWAQLIWAAAVVWRLSRLWLGLGLAGNALVLVVYVASRTAGLPFGPDRGPALAAIAGRASGAPPERPGRVRCGLHLCTAHQRRVVPYPGGPFSDDLSRGATSAAVRAVLAR